MRAGGGAPYLLDFGRDINKPHCNETRIIYFFRVIKESS